MAKGDRIDGWKAIGAHFGRDRTTAIRWARERGLPVHRIPGGKTATVYALRDELDAWTRGQSVGGDSIEPQDPPPLPEPTLDVAPSPHRPRWIWLVGGALAAAIAVAVLAVTVPILSNEPPAPAIAARTALPTNADVAEDYLTARDLVADRRAEGLERAIPMLESVTRRDPGYAPGHAGLAEALLLAREFGARRDGDAFPQARAAARTALRLDPDLAIANRTLGFVTYWWDHDFATAQHHFKLAIARAPGDAVAHFWYGNVLSDHGDHADALRELNAARALQPGSVAIQTDLAWAQWAAGDDERPLQALRAIVARNPDFAVAHDCIGAMLVGRGDFSGAAAAFARVADLRRDAALIADAKAVAQAGPSDAPRILLSQALAQVAEDATRNHGWAAYLASSAGNRMELLRILALAERRKERWGDAGFILRIQRRWHGDDEVTRLLDLRRPR